MLDQEHVIFEFHAILLNRKVKRKDQHVSVRHLASQGFAPQWLFSGKVQP